MKNKITSLLLCFILIFTPILFAGCDSFEEDLKDSAGSSLGSSGGSSNSQSFFKDILSGFKVVCSDSLTGSTNKIQELSNNFYFGFLNSLTSTYGYRKGEGDGSNFIDDIRQKIYEDNSGNAALMQSNDGKDVSWLWTLDNNIIGISKDLVGGKADGTKTIAQILADEELLWDDYPQMSTYYSTPMQIVLYETMLGLEQTTFEVQQGSTITLEKNGVTNTLTAPYFIITVKNCPANSALNGKVIYERVEAASSIITVGENTITFKVEEKNQTTAEQDVLNYLGYFEEDGKQNGGLKLKYYSKAKYSGLTKTDADRLIDYILNNIIGEEVIEHDYNTFYDTNNYRNYVQTIANYIYELVYDGSGDTFEYEYKIDNNNSITVSFEPTVKKGEAAPKPASFVRDYTADKFFETDNMFESSAGFDNSPFSEYQSVAIMVNEQTTISGLWMQIFCVNPEFNSKIALRYWAYDEETGEGQLFEWEQEAISFYHSSPIVYHGEPDSEYVEGKGYLYKTTQHDNNGNEIHGYYTDFMPEINIEGVPDKFVVPCDRSDPNQIQIDSVIIDKFENTDGANDTIKLKADGEEVIEGVTEGVLQDGDYAYKVIPSRNGFGGVTVLDESKINFTFLELVFDLHKNAADDNQSYNFKLSVITPL